MTDKITENPIIIFFRTSEENIEKALAAQQRFLKSLKDYSAITVVDCPSYDGFRTLNALELIRKPHPKLIVITQNYLDSDEFGDEYRHLKVIELFQEAGRLELYHMDARGSLYKYIKDILPKL